MNNKFTLLAVLLLGIFLVNAQTPNYNSYGDGSLRLLSQRYREWSTQTFEWLKNDSTAYNYNTQGRESEKRIFNAPANAWQYWFIGTKTYTATGKALVFTDSSLTTIQGCRRYTYAYNANDQETLLTAERVSLGNWVLYARNQTNYTAFDSVNVLLTQEYNNNVWTNFYRYLHTYNAQNRDTSVTYEIWTNNQWKGYSRQIHTLNSNGSLANSISQQYDTVTASYKNYSQRVFLYDANNRVTSNVLRYWDAANNFWVNSSTFSYSYDANGNLENVLAEEWDVANLEWDFFSLITYTYDAGSKLTNSLFQTRNGSLWENVSRRAYTYNAQGYMTFDLQERWNTSTLAWDNYDENAYWYEANPINSITETEKTKLFVFPNPSSSPVTFVNADKNIAYAVYDMQGRMIQQGDLQPGTNSIVLNEAKGNYILKAGNNSTVLVKQ